jgi:hypothetical protein
MCSLGLDEKISDGRHDERLLSLRSAVILLAALFVSGVVGILVFVTSHHLADAFLAGGWAFVAAAGFCHNTVISRRA